MGNKFDKLKYDTKYTLGSYADLALSLPIELARGTSGLVEKVLGERTPEFLTRQNIEENSPVYKTRENLINKYGQNMPEILQYATNSLATLTAQMVAGYTTFMANEVRVNHNKYVGENGKLNPRKIKDGF